MDEKPAEGETAKFTINSLFSFQVIVIFIGFGVWLVRLSDKVEKHDSLFKQASKMKSRIYQLEEQLKMKHPLPSDEE